MNISLLAVFVSGIAAMIIGMLWFGPLFGKKWMALSGVNQKDMEKAKKEGGSMGIAYLLQFIAALLTAYVLAMFVGFVGAKDAAGGAMVGFWVWLGFVATTNLGSILWERKSVALYLLKNGHVLVNFLVMGIILATIA